MQAAGPDLEGGITWWLGLRLMILWLSCNFNQIPRNQSRYGCASFISLASEPLYNFRWNLCAYYLFFFFRVYHVDNVDLSCLAVNKYFLFIFYSLMSNIVTNRRGANVYAVVRVISAELFCARNDKQFILINIALSRPNQSNPQDRTLCNCGSALPWRRYPRVAFRPCVCNICGSPQGLPILCNPRR